MSSNTHESASSYPSKAKAWEMPSGPRQEDHTLGYTQVLNKINSLPEGKAGPLRRELDEMKHDEGLGPEWRKMWYLSLVSAGRTGLSGRGASSSTATSPSDTVQGNRP